MLYLTYDGQGRITGAYQQELRPEHESAYVEVTPEQYVNRFDYIIQGGELVAAPAGTYAAPLDGSAAFRAMKEREARQLEEAGDELGALQLRLKHNLFS